MRANKLSKLFLVGTLVLGLAVPFVAAEKSAKTPAGKSPADQGRKVQPTLSPIVSGAYGFSVSRPLRDIAAERAAQEGPIQTMKKKIVPNQPLPWEDEDEDETIRQEAPGTGSGGPDGALQANPPFEAMPAPTSSFDGVSNDDNATAFGFRISPPDTDGAVGPNHYVQAVNLLVAIYDKSGTLLVPKFKMSALFASLGAPCGTEDDGDPIVLYDRLADRWLVSQFVLPNYPNGPFYQEIAISQTGDPTGAYYIYCFLVHATKMNDYPHFGIWPDGYYMTCHQFNPNYAGQGVWCFDRLKMLAGDPTATFVYFDLNSLDPGIGGMLPGDADGYIPPPVGAPDIFAYPIATEWGDAIDGMRLFNFHVDWAVPANSTFTERAESPIAVAAYDPRNPSGRKDVNQPPPATNNSRVDSISDRLMHRLQYRNFGSTESLIACQSVDALAYPSYRAAVRYCQMKNASLGGAFSAAEQATFSPDTDHRWMGSAACDWQGNLAVGYSVSSTTTFPSVRYAGRLVSDPANQLTQGEATLVSGSGVQRDTSNNRWGDYSALTMDPTDDATFWYTQEYYTAASQGTSTVGWLTRIGSFKFLGVPASPRGTVTAHVTNCVTGLPIQHVIITTPEGYFGATDAAGNAVLTMAPGSYTVTASKSTYLAPVSLSGTVVDGANTVLNFCLQPTVPLMTVGPSSLVAEACVPPNGVIDPNEQVTVSFCVNNIGSAPTINLVGTLQATGGVVNPGAPATFGVVAGEGGQGCASLTFAADYTLACRSTLTATIHLQDGALDLGNVVYTFTLGTLGAPATLMTQNFDGVTAPALPAGWTSTLVSGSGGVWVTKVGTAHPSGYAAHSASNLVYFNSWTVSSGTSARLAYGTPFDFTAPGGYSLSFWMFHDGQYNNPDVVQAQVSTDGGTTWQNVGAAVPRFVSGTYAWQKHTIDLTGFTGPLGAVRVALLCMGMFGNDCHVDDISVEMTPYLCCVCPPITIAPAVLPGATMGVPYNQTLTASGTAGPYTYAVTGGALPTELNLSAGGVISGTSTATGAASFTITATDAVGCTGSASYAFATYGANFLDDGNASRFCVDFLTGIYGWGVTAPPASFYGRAEVMNGGAYIWNGPSDRNFLYMVYDAVHHKAYGYYYDTAGMHFYSFYDSDTTNNAGGCP
jgi:hypothetical protein